jgi:hypothetical protein
MEVEVEMGGVGGRGEDVGEQVGLRKELRFLDL